jgi:hypothetical protein
MAGSLLENYMRTHQDLDFRAPRVACYPCSAAPWTAGAVLPLFLCEAMLRTPVVGSMAPDPKAPAWLAHSKVCPEIWQIYSGQYWDQPPVAPKQGVSSSKPNLGVAFI